jgi:hypothetical protein
MGGSNGQQMPEIWTGAGNAGSSIGASESINFPIPNSQFGGIVGSASNAIGRTGDTVQNFFAGELGTGAQPRPDYKPDMTSSEQKQQQQYQQQQQLKDLLNNAGKTTQPTSSPYDRAAKSQSDSASAWTAMQRSSGDGTGSLAFSPMGGYNVPSSGAEKVSQGWADAAKTIGSSAIAGMGKPSNKVG